MKVGLDWPIQSANRRRSNDAALIWTCVIGTVRFVDPPEMVSPVGQTLSRFGSCVVVAGVRDRQENSIFKVFHYDYYLAGNGKLRESIN